MFDEENLISLAIFLSFCLFVHNTFVQPWLWGYVFFSKFLCFLHNFHFFREIFVLFFTEIFGLFFALFFARNLSIIFFREISAFSISRKFRTDGIKISRKKRKFSHFLRANEMLKQSEMVGKHAKFFLFAGNPNYN